MGQKFSNNARSRLVGSLSSSATSFTVESATSDLFPIANTTDWLTVNDWFKAVLEDSSGNIEIVHVGSRNSGSGLLTNVLRGQEGTAARTFNAGATVSLRLTAADFETALAKFEDVSAFMLTLMDDADAAAARATLGATAVGGALFTAANAAVARATLDVPTRTGTNASGEWNIEAATALLAADAQLLDGIDSTGFTRSTGTSELGSVARTSGNLSGGFTGGMQARNAGTGAGTATFYDAVLGGVTAGGVQFLRNSDGSVEARIGRTPAGDPAVDRRVYDLILRGDGILTGPGFLPTGGAGAIGYPALLFSRSTNITIGNTYAGSSLRAQGLARASDSVCTTADNAGPAQTGTWLALTTQSAGSYGCLAFFIRIS